jgi:hypothetical protein
LQPEVTIFNKEQEKYSKGNVVGRVITANANF